MSEMTADTESRGSQRIGARSTVTVTRRAADQLRTGHLWAYRSEVQPFGHSEAGRNGPRAEPDRGSLVDVVDGRGIPLGTALYSVGSEIALRMVAPKPGVNRSEYLQELRRRVAAAIALRSELAPLSDRDTGRRLIFSEADGLPGIVADQYGDIVVVQLLLQGTAQLDVREAVGRALSGVFPTGKGTIWERTDSRIREIEALDAAPEAPLWIAGEPRSHSTFTINGLQFLYDAGAGQKTGAFLDQRLNYQAAATLARGRGLDICTYQGGFALHLARLCERVTGVDASRAALEVADRNLDLNRDRVAAAVDWIEADAFDLMRAYQDSGERFGTIVLDPPAFAKTKRATDSALRGYKELNLRALRMLESGGTLVTCSCSHHISIEEFMNVLTSASVDAGRRVQLLETRGAAPDHPAILAMPETSYLKCLICRVG